MSLTHYIRDQRTTADVVFAAYQDVGTQKAQADVFAHFDADCFALADGVGAYPGGDIAAQIAAETVVWAYKHIRLRKTNWFAKKLLMQRMFRSTNLSIWQKHKEPGYTSGIFTTLTVVIIGPENVWVGNIGDTSAYLIREGMFIPLTTDDVDREGNLTNMLGAKRLGMIPHFVSEAYIPGDVIVLGTDGCMDYVTEEEIRDVLEHHPPTDEALDVAAKKIIALARQHGSSANASVCLMERIRV